MANLLLQSILLMASSFNYWFKVPTTNLPDNPLCSCANLSQQSTLLMAHLPEQSMILLANLP
jgi:hypothetical protein